MSIYISIFHSLKKNNFLILNIMAKLTLNGVIDLVEQHMGETDGLNHVYQELLKYKARRQRQQKGGLRGTFMRGGGGITFSLTNTDTSETESVVKSDDDTIKKYSGLVQSMVEDAGEDEESMVVLPIDKVSVENLNLILDFCRKLDEEE